MKGFENIVNEIRESIVEKLNIAANELNTEEITAVMLTRTEFVYIVEAVKLLNKNQNVRIILGPNGEIFQSYRQVIEKYGTPQWQYEMRIKAGWSTYEAITGNADHDYIQDCFGKKYSSLHEMVTSYKLPMNDYCRRRFSGMGEEEALTKKLTAQEQENGKFKMPDGKIFRSIQEIGKVYGIKKGDIIESAHNGLSLGKMLKKYSEKADGNNKSSKRKVVDPYGNTFKSYKDMCRVWGTNYGKFLSRRSSGGWSLYDMLTVDANKIVDKKGRQYINYIELAKSYGCNLDKFMEYFINQKLTSEESIALSIR